MSEPMPLTIRGQRWRLVRRSIRANVGLCDADTRTITVRRNLTGLDELDTTIHELLHAAHWDLAEEAVEETASDIARALWAMGYRRGDSTGSRQ